MNNRAERRRAEREARREGYSKIDPNLKASLSMAVKDNLREQDIRNRAILAATGPMMETVYAAVILLLTEDYGFSHDQCLDLLRKLEDKTLYCFDHNDILEEAFNKTGIRINFRAAFDRIEEDTKR